MTEQADRAQQEVELEAAVLRRLLRHFDEHKEVQNIELMTLAGFCRNCLSKWFVEAASERGLTVDADKAREKIYGMPYSEWKERYQPPATEEQLARFAAAEKAKGEQVARRREARIASSVAGPRTARAPRARRGTSRSATARARRSRSRPHCGLSPPCSAARPTSRSRAEST